MNVIVTIFDGEAVTTTLAIAGGTENEHASVILLVRKYLADLEEFGGVRFEIAPFETAGGVQKREVAILNEQQATLLLTYMRNSEIVRAFKKRLVKEFWQMAERLRQPAVSVPQTLPEALRLAADLAEQKAEAERQKLILEEKVAEQAPKVEAFDRISADTDTLTITEAAKILGVKRSDLTARMHAEGWVYRQNSSWVAYDRRIKDGCLQYKEANYTDEKTGMACVKPYCHITPKGMTKLALMLGSLPPPVRGGRGGRTDGRLLS